MPRESSQRTLLALVVLFSFFLICFAGGQAPQGDASTSRKKVIENLFHATGKSWPAEGRLRLSYTFNFSADKLTGDFFPAISSVNKNIRYSTPGDRRRGLIIAEYGQFLHKARWKNVTMDMKFTSYSVSRKGDLLAAALSDSKGKRAMGCNMGRSMVNIVKGKVAGKPMPLVFPQAARRTAMHYGCEFKDATFRCRLNGATAKDPAANPIETKKLPKWLKKTKTGHVGFIWRGQTQGYINEIVIEGELDDEWLQKQLGKGKSKE